MIKKAFFYTVLSLTYAIGMALKVIGNGFLSIAENILIRRFNHEVQHGLKIA